MTIVRALVLENQALSSPECTPAYTPRGHLPGAAQAAACPVFLQHLCSDASMFVTQCACAHPLPQPLSQGTSWGRVCVLFIFLVCLECNRCSVSVFRGAFALFWQGGGGNAFFLLSLPYKLVSPTPTARKTSPVLRSLIGK